MATRTSRINFADQFLDQPQGEEVRDGGGDQPALAAEAWPTNSVSYFVDWLKSETQR